MAVQPALDVESEGGQPAAPETSGPRAWVVHLFALGWLLATGLATLAPAFAHGASLGPYNYLSQFPFTHLPGVPGSFTFRSDLVSQMIPWTDLAWTQVHHGQLPLWDPYSALGMPLAFNWQSAVFSVPALVGYLFPQRLDYTVQVVATLWLAGAGVYVLGRVLRMNLVGCLLAGTAFQMGGEFFQWLGWPVAGVLSWTGWVFAATIVVIRGRRRIRSVILLSCALAAMIYAGQPDTLILVVIALAVFCVVAIALAALRERQARPLVRPTLDLAIGAVGGVCLAAPLLFPGASLISGSVRSQGGSALNSQLAIPIANLAHFAYPGAFGVYLVPTKFYFGIIPVLMVVIALRFRFRNRWTVAFAAVGLVSFLLSFVGPVTKLANDLPGLGAVRFPRATGTLVFALAVLAGIGLTELTRRLKEAQVRKFAWIVFSVAAAVPVVVLAIDTTGAKTWQSSASQRGALWTLCGIATCMGVLAAISVLGTNIGAGKVSRSGAAAGAEELARSRTVALWCGLALVVFETIYLVSVGSTIWTSSPHGLTPTTATARLHTIVGSSTVGLGVSSCLSTPSPWILPDANSSYDVQELAVYDPLVPRKYFQAWESVTGQTPGSSAVSCYSPVITSVAVARLYGVRFVIVPPGTSGPAGARYVQTIAGQHIYRVPGSYDATVTPLTAAGGLPVLLAKGAPVPVSHPNPRMWRMSTATSQPSVLRLRLTNVPGWHASIDGRPLPLLPFSTVMLQARIPPGRHTVTLTYWPDRFTIGIVLAAVATLAMAGAAAFGMLLRRRHLLVHGGPGRAPEPTDLERGS